MIEERAVVLESNGEHAVVETQKESSCNHCEVGHGCGLNVLSKVFGNRAKKMLVINPIDANVGDPVIIGIEESALIRGSLAVYGVPLVGLIGGALFGQQMGLYLGLNQELISMVAGIGTMMLCFRWVRLFSHSVRKDSRFQPVILRRLDRIPVHIERHSTVN